ncbi:MAG TPA: choice-of-anchor I family protein [Polyangiaceae bacterium]|nr:choice-of-anchor I family protein [Polyangiaceae bacterium]
MFRTRHGQLQRSARSGVIVSWSLALLAAACTGETGPVGPMGLQGPEGKQGPQGEPGVDGKDGVDGTDGKDGVNGTDGKDGVDGTDGADGEDGKDGTNGKDGVDGSDATPRPVGLSLSLLGRHSTGLFDEGSQEIISYDSKTGRLFTMNAAAQTVDVLNISDPQHPARVGTIDVTQADARALGDITSVSARAGLVAVAVGANPRTDPGLVLFYDAQTLALRGKVEVGALPDMITFTPDGTKIVVAIEGEPNDDYTVDPEGAVGIIGVPDDFTGPIQYTTADFHAFDTKAAELRAKGVRIFGPKHENDTWTPSGATVSQDLEPEYVAVSADSKKAWVTLQENNAIAVVNLETASVEEIRPLGFKNFNLLGNEFDPSDKDKGAYLRAWPVYGMYMPDAVARFEVAGETYLVTANEGDVRAFGDFNDAVRVSTLELDPVAFPNASELKADAALGRLQVTPNLGDSNADHKYERLYAFGGRSFSIWKADTGQLIYDSGNELELITAKRLGDGFNSSHAASGGDARSDDKGPEPEGVTVATIEGSTFAFITLERPGGVMIYDVTLPESPRFVSYVNTRDITQTYGGEGFVWDEAAQQRIGDLGPEASVYIPSTEPGEPGILALGNEVSGTTVLFRVTPLYGVLP